MLPAMQQYKPNFRLFSEANERLSAHGFCKLLYALSRPKSPHLARMPLVCARPARCKTGITRLLFWKLFPEQLANGLITWSTPGQDSTSAFVPTSVKTTSTISGPKDYIAQYTLHTTARAATARQYSWGPEGSCFLSLMHFCLFAIHFPPFCGDFCEAVYSAHSTCAIDVP